MKNKKGLIIALVCVAIVVIIIIAGVSKYNGFVSMEEDVNSAKSEISVMLQRRADLIPNFVNTVKGYTNYEQSTLTAVTEARAAVGKANTVSESEAASNQLDKAIDVWVNAVTEAYPDLKADKQYIALEDELAGSENRLAVARKDYNDKAKEYNSSIRKFPASIIAGICGFEKVDYFEASENASSVPSVNF